MFTKFGIWIFLENLCRKFKFHLNVTRITDTLHEDLQIFMIISYWILLKWEMFQTNVIKKIKTHIYVLLTLSRKSCSLWDSAEKYGTARQATDGNIIRRMRFAYWITKAIDTLRICNSYCFFHDNNGYANAPQYYVMRTLPLLFFPTCVRFKSGVLYVYIIFRDIWYFAVSWVCCMFIRRALANWKNAAVHWLVLCFGDFLPYWKVSWFCDINLIYKQLYNKSRTEMPWNVSGRH
jgi:hypothetical protein